VTSAKPRRNLGTFETLLPYVRREEDAMARYRLSVNGKGHEVEAEPNMPLLWVLRDRLGLTGTKFGCGVGVCGACTVLMDGNAVRSCQVPLSDAGGRRFTTIEGLSRDGSHPCQRAWLAEDVAQCGYCQAGMILEAAALLARKSTPTDADVDAAFSDHVCRCGTWQRVRRAVHRAAGLEGALTPAEASAHGGVR
jgi:isoquinoline 1-oxidoreductase subunit alpha